MINLVHWRPIDCCIVVTLALGLLGCSMHPLPEDISRASTVDIVRRIRCEVWEGLSGFQLNEPRVKRIVEGTAIGYDFTFDVTETNSASKGMLKFERPSFQDKSLGFVIELDADASKVRQNTRTFRIIEPLTELNESGCSEATTQANSIYPITGATGMAEVIRTYIRLQILTKLVRDKDSGVVFSDELKYTTNLSTGVTPTLELNSVQGRLKLTKTSIIGSASRDDVHSVTVALSRDEAHADVHTDSGGVRLGKNSQAERFAEVIDLKSHGILVRRSPLTQMIKRDAGARDRVLFELQRRRNVREDARVVARVLGTP